MKIEHIAEHVCLYGKNYLEGEFNLCETCAQYDWTSPAQVRKECKDIESIMSMMSIEQDLIRKESFDKGVEEGMSAQAIIEIQGRERFLNGLKKEHTEQQALFVDALKQAKKELVFLQNHIESSQEDLQRHTRIYARLTITPTVLKQIDSVLKETVK